MTLSICPLVQGLDIFRNVSRPDLADILADARVRKFREGATVFVQGTPASRFFLLLTGRLKIVQVTPGGMQIVAHFVAPGQFFGLAVAMGRDDYPGSALTVVDSTTLSWPTTAWDRLASRHPALVAGALHMVGGFLQEAFTRLQEVVGARVEQRIAHALLRLARQSGRRTEEGILIEFPITRRDIAEMTSTTLHTVSRTLSAWEQAGLLAGGRRRIVIRDPHALVRIIDED